MKDCGIALLNVVCMTSRSYIQTAAAIQSEERFQQLRKRLIRNCKRFPVLLVVPFHPSLARLVLSVGQTIRSSPVQFPASSSQAPRPQRVNSPGQQYL